MGTSRLLAYSGAITVAALAFFLFGFCFSGPLLSFEIGLALGIMSASAWACGSIGGPPVWNNWANVFAAFFAVLSLGFLAPADQVCQGANGLLRKACELRVRSH